MTSAEIREAFLGYFERNGHRRVPSDSLIPSNDPTLLLTNAGMVQFKPLYVARRKPYTRAASCQRCFRTTDIDQVGLTARHLTFFEMLGNFSFGDYFKEGAIDFAWEFVTRELRLDPELMFITVFESDDEAERLWRRHVPAGKIVRFGEDDNYWPAGSALKGWVGPNGPCSEIFYDTGPENCRFGRKCSKPGEHECDRFPEIWDLVFPQFIRSQDGTNPRMESPGIDTGMGLERLAAVMQGKRSLFETDVFLPLMERAGEMLRRQGSGLAEPELARARRIVSDHTRAATFLVSDGVVPSNEGRGYILRRIVRRAVRQTALSGDAFPIVSPLVSEVVRRMGASYPEMARREADIASAILAEEKHFMETLHRGLEELGKESSSSPLTGDRAFYLYDTFGFPRELTEDIWVREMGRDLSSGFGEEYESALAGQQERARAAWKGSGARALTEAHHALSRDLASTVFLGYAVPAAEATVTAIVGGSGDSVPEAKAGQTVDVILDRTPFYAEAGGQVADLGWLDFPGGRAEVLDVQRPLGGMFIHKTRVVEGAVHVGAKAGARIDQERRAAIARHHTATHLMHAALQQVVGKTATQAGSFVGPDRLRFDFMSARAVAPDQLRRIEEIVNAKVLENIPVVSTETTPEDARRQGAQALFGEKYGDRVRVVGVPGFSLELCGGTHVPATGHIGPFVIASEGAVASGIRRIEALVGGAALAALFKGRESLERLAELLKCAPRDLAARVGKLLDEKKALEDGLRETKVRRAGEDLAGRLAEADQVGGVGVLVAEVEADSPGALRILADQALDRLKEGVVVLGSRGEGKCFLVARVSGALSGRVPAGEIVRMAATAIGGKGGGKPEMAQSGGKDPARLPEALSRAREYVDETLKGKGS